MSRRRTIGISLAVILLLALAGTALWLFWPKSELKIASCLPADTIFLARIHDGTHSYIAYQESNLKQVVESPEVCFLATTLLEKNLTQLAALGKIDPSQTQELLSLLERSLDGESFLAITHFDPQFFLDPQFPANAAQKEWPMVVGWHPRRGEKASEELLVKVKDLMRQRLPGATEGVNAYHGYSYHWFGLPTGGNKICRAQIAGWTIVTFGETSLHDLIDYYQKKTQAPSLEQTASYKAVEARLEKESDATFYMSLEALKAPTLALLKTQPTPQEKASKFFDLYKYLTAFGLSVRFDAHHELQDTFVTLMAKETRPDFGKSYEPCAFETFKFTNADTVLYSAGNFDFRKQYDFASASYKTSFPEMAENVKDFESTVAHAGLDLNKNILDAIGPEIAFILEWPHTNTFPDAGFFVQLSHPDDFKPVIDYFTKTAADWKMSENNVELPMGVWADAKVGNYDLKTYKLSRKSPFSPTFLVSGDFFGFFLTEEGASRILSHNQSTTLKDDAVYKTAMTDQELDGSTAQSYVNLSRLIDQVYQAAKPYYPMVVNSSPDLKASLGGFPPPNKLTFAEPLGVWTMTAKIDDEANVVRSRSGIGTPLLPLFAVSAGGAYLQNQQLEHQKVRMAQLAKNRSINEPNKEEPAASSPTSVTVPVATSDTLAMAPSPAPPTSADEVRAQLEELRTVIDNWASNQKIPNGTAVTWEAIQPFLIPDSPLEKSEGKDALGNPYDLGVIGQRISDVTPETKVKFPDKDAAFWAPSPEP